MFGYQLRLAWKSLRRNPGHSLIVCAGIALGVAVSTLFATVRHSFAKDPIPEKSDVLYYVRLDSWDPNQPYPGNVPPPQVTYQDMTALMRSDIPVRQSGSFKTQLYVFPDEKVGRPQREVIRLMLRRLLRHVRHAVPLRRRVGREGGRRAGAGPGPVRGDERAAVRRREQRRTHGADREPDVPRGRRARPLAAERQVLRSHPVPGGAAGADLHAVQLAAPDGAAHRRQQRRLEVARRSPASPASSPRRPASSRCGSSCAAWPTCRATGRSSTPTRSSSARAAASSARSTTGSARSRI